MLTYALVQTHDDLLNMVLGESIADYDQAELTLDREVIPTWGDMTGRRQGGNQNTLRYVHLDQNFLADRLPAYRQVVDLG